MGIAGLSLVPHLSKSGKSFLFHSCTSDVIVISQISQWVEICKKTLKPSSPGIQRFLANLISKHWFSSMNLQNVAYSFLWHSAFSLWPSAMAIRFFPFCLHPENIKNLKLFFLKENFFKHKSDLFFFICKFTFSFSLDKIFPRNGFKILLFSWRKQKEENCKLLQMA